MIYSCDSRTHLRIDFWRDGVSLGNQISTLSRRSNSAMAAITSSTVGIGPDTMAGVPELRIGPSMAGGELL